MKQVTNTSLEMVGPMALVYPNGKKNWVWQIKIVFGMFSFSLFYVRVYYSYCFKPKYLVSGNAPLIFMILMK